MSEARWPAHSALDIRRCSRCKQEASFLQARPPRHSIPCGHLVCGDCSVMARQRQGRDVGDEVCCGDPGCMQALDLSADWPLAWGLNRSVRLDAAMARLLVDQGNVGVSLAPEAQFASRGHPAVTAAAAGATATGAGGDCGAVVPGALSGAPPPLTYRQWAWGLCPQHGHPVIGLDAARCTVVCKACAVWGRRAVAAGEGGATTDNPAAAGMAVGAGFLGSGLPAAVATAIFPIGTKISEPAAKASDCSGGGGAGEGSAASPLAYYVPLGEAIAGLISAVPKRDRVWRWHRYATFSDDIIGTGMGAGGVKPLEEFLGALVSDYVEASRRALETIQYPAESPASGASASGADDVDDAPAADDVDNGDGRFWHQTPWKPSAQPQSQQAQARRQSVERLVGPNVNPWPLLGPEEKEDARSRYGADDLAVSASQRAAAVPARKPRNPVKPPLDGVKAALMTVVEGKAERMRAIGAAWILQHVLLRITGDEIAAELAEVVDDWAVAGGAAAFAAATPTAAVDADNIDAAAGAVGAAAGDAGSAMATSTSVARSRLLSRRGEILHRLAVYSRAQIGLLRLLGTHGIRVPHARAFQRWAVFPVELRSHAGLISLSVDETFTAHMAQICKAVHADSEAFVPETVWAGPVDLVPFVPAPALPKAMLYARTSDATSGAEMLLVIAPDDDDDVGGNSSAENAGFGGDQANGGKRDDRYTLIAVVCNGGSGPHLYSVTVVDVVAGRIVAVLPSTEPIVGMARSSSRPWAENGPASASASPACSRASGPASFAETGFDYLVTLTSHSMDVWEVSELRLAASSAAKDAADAAAIAAAAAVGEAAAEAELSTHGPARRITTGGSRAPAPLPVAELCPAATVPFVGRASHSKQQQQQQQHHQAAPAGGAVTAHAAPGWPPFAAVSQGHSGGFDSRAADLAAAAAGSAGTGRQAFDVDGLTRARSLGTAPLPAAGALAASAAAGSSAGGSGAGSRVFSGGSGSLAGASGNGAGQSMSGWGGDGGGGSRTRKDVDVDALLRDVYLEGDAVDGDVDSGDSHARAARPVEASAGGQRRVSFDTALDDDAAVAADPASGGDPEAHIGIIGTGSAIGAAGGSRPFQGSGLPFASLADISLNGGGAGRNQFSFTPQPRPSTSPSLPLARPADLGPSLPMPPRTFAGSPSPPANAHAPHQSHNWGSGAGVGSGGSLGEAGHPGGGFGGPLAGPPYEAPAHGLAALSNGYVAVAFSEPYGQPGRFEIFDLATLTLVQTLNVDVKPGSGRLFVELRRGVLAGAIVVNTPGGHVMIQREEPLDPSPGPAPAVSAASASASARTLASAFASAAASAPSLQRRHRLPRSYVQFSDCGQSIGNHHSAGSSIVALEEVGPGLIALGYSGADCGRIRLVRPKSAAVVGMLTGHTGDVCALRLIAEDVLASIARDNTARVWDVSRSLCLRTITLDRPPPLYTHAGIELRAFPRDILCGGMGMLPSGVLAVACKDGLLRMWDVSGSLQLIEPEPEGGSIA